jgi:hypothetical protein
MKTTLLLLLAPLACPVFSIAASTPQQSSSGLAWQESERTNTADAFTFSRFTLAGKFLTPLPDALPNRPALVVDCIPAKESPRGRGTFLAGNLLVGTNLKVTYVESEEIPSGITGMFYFPKIPVRYRIDDAKKEERDQWSPTSAKTEYQWSPESDRTSASIPKHSLEEILRARNVAITTNDDHGRKVVVQFDMPDPALVEKACRVEIPATHWRTQ